MKKILIPFLLLILVACAPMIAPATATPTSTITPSPTTTFTPSPTATITFTPTPSLPPEIISSIGNRPYKLRTDGSIWVTETDGQEHKWFYFDQNYNEWDYSQEYLQGVLTQATITPENSYPPNDYTMKFYERQFHGIFLNPSITRTETRTDLVGQSYEITCTRIAFYDKNTNEARTAWVALTTVDNGEVIQLMQHAEGLSANKAYRMKILVEATASQGEYTKEKSGGFYYRYNLLYFPFKNAGDFFNRMFKSESVSWPKDTIFPVHSLLTAFYGRQ